MHFPGRTDVLLRSALLAGVQRINGVVSGFVYLVYFVYLRSR